MTLSPPPRTCHNWTNFWRPLRNVTFFPGGLCAGFFLTHCVLVFGVSFKALSLGLASSEHGGYLWLA